jgi:hypothetical protein
VEALPKEMQDMKIKDDRIDHSDDKVSIFSSCQQAIISAAFAHVV